MCRTTDVSPPVKNNTDRMNELVGRHCYWIGGLCDSGSQTLVGTTDVSPPVINNTDRMKWLVG